MIVKMIDAYKAQCRQLDFHKRKDKLGNEIKMNMTFEEWHHIWLMSGKWDRRGNKGHQYVMARINDIGHYDANNVKIITQSENISEGHLGKKLSDETKHQMSKNRKGKPKPPRTDKHCANLRKPKSEQMKRRLSESQKGKIISESTKKKLSLIHKVKGSKPNPPLCSCVICGKEMTTNLIKRHHNICGEKHV